MIKKVFNAAALAFTVMWTYDVGQFISASSDEDWQSVPISTIKFSLIATIVVTGIILKVLPDETNS